jgi:type I restriction enzyme, R subunit
MKNHRPSFAEDHISQIPALMTLIRLWYKYISPLEALDARGGKQSNVILETILRKQLHKINSISKGSSYTTVFSDANIEAGIRALKDVPFNEWYISATEYVYNLLTLWKTLDQSIDGDKKSFNLQYIDWKHPENNVYHITQEFSVLRSWSNETYRPDIVLFVNGIPLCVIECKRPDIKNSLQQSVSQHIRNQQESWIRQLYVYSQLNIWVNTDSWTYATAGTPEKFRAHWKEKFEREHEAQQRKEYEERLYTIKNAPLSWTDMDRLFTDEFAYVRRYIEAVYSEEVLPTIQDEYLVNLCDPKRLLELTFGYILYDENIKKIARYQQYFAVKKTLGQISTIQWGKRAWWVIWHTQWSGKSLTMVMLAQAITSISNIKHAKIIIVTDRTDLDKQISDTFRKCNMIVDRATTGKHLSELLESKSDAVITTIVNKFESAIKGIKQPLESPNIFVLIDEWHRTQYGNFNMQMKRTLPNACFLAFTGTPLTKKEKSTAVKFWKIIDAYTVTEAVADQTVVPLLYEWRHAHQEVNAKPLDTYFAKIVEREHLTDKQKADLKKKFARADQLNIADQKVYAIAWDISNHFQENRQGTWFKGQLVCQRKATAIKYKQYLDEIGIVSSEVVMSSPDDREGEDDVYDTTDNIEKKFWQAKMQEFGNEKKYETTMINRFKYSDEPEIIIVVDKLLTWFDEPKNVVMYLTRKLVWHTLLQAIARVNRVAENKDFGYVIDYYGVLGDLDEALNTYSALAGFEDDVNDSLVNIQNEIDKLPQLHTDLWGVFSSVKNQRDLEAFQQLLKDQAIRDEFYTRLRNYAKALKVALSSMKFYDETPVNEIDIYKKDLAMFYKLRQAVASRYSDEIDYKKYEAQVQKLIDTHITTDDVTTIVESVNIFEREKFEKELEKVGGTKARADTIASRTSKYIDEKFDEDPAFYKKFSVMLREVLDAYEQGRIQEQQYLERVEKIMNDVLAHKGVDFPWEIASNNFAKAIFGIAKEFFAEQGISPEEIAEVALFVALKTDEVFASFKIVNRHKNKDIINKMKLWLFDVIYDEVKHKYDLSVWIQDIDLFVEKCIWIAKLQK